MENCYEEKIPSPEIIFCKVPTDKECAVHLRNISWNDTQESLWHELHGILSKFGLLYNIHVARSKYGNDYYAFARYYSRRAAAAALSWGNSIIINQQRVRMSPTTSNTHIVFRNSKLNSRSMQDLISYYFGFNYLSSQILCLEKELCEETVLKYSCLIRISTRDGLVSDGVGLGEAPFDGGEEGAPGLGGAFKMARKFAVESASADALSKFVLIVLSNGKRLMEVDTTRHDPLYLHAFVDDAVVKDIHELIEDPEMEEEEENEGGREKEEEEEDSIEEENGKALEKSEWVENLSDSLLERLLNS